MTTKIAIINFGPGVVKVSPVFDSGPSDVGAETIQPGQVSVGIRYTYPGVDFLVEEISG